jgi:hypothetical protein
LISVTDTAEGRRADQDRFGAPQLPAPLKLGKGRIESLIVCWSKNVNGKKKSFSKNHLDPPWSGPCPEAVIIFFIV